MWKNLPRADKRFRPLWAIWFLPTSLAGCASLSTAASTAGIALMIWPPLIVLSLISLPLLPYYLAVEGLPGRRGAEFAMFMPGGQHLLVAYKSGRNCHLYRASIDGSEWTPLTEGNRFDFDPEISPDGTQIVFASRIAPQTSNLFIMNTDGTDMRALTTGRREDWAPRFSPDGTRIVFSSIKGRKQADLYVVETDGTNLRQLTDDKDSHDICPVFLSDSATIVFARAVWWGHSSPIASSDWHRFDLYTMDIYGTAPRKLSERCFYNLEGLMVSPDDSRIIAIACDTVATFTRDASGELSMEAKELLCDTYSGPCGKRRGGFSITADGSRIIFMTSDWDLPEARNNAIHVAPVDTLNAEVIIESDKPMLTPRFSPDGSRIVYRVETHPTGNKTLIEVWIANSDGSASRRVNGPSQDADPPDHANDKA